MKIIAMIMIAIGVVLLGFGTFMRAKQIEIESTKTEIIPGNKGKAAAVGAVTGAVAGAGAAATVGGVGVVLCGTGFGIPAGAVCVLAAGVCSLIGGAGGALAGKPTTMSTISVTEVVNAYSPCEYWTVIIVGCLLVSLGFVFLFWKAIRKRVDEKRAMGK